MMSTCSISKSEGRVVLFLSFDQGYFCPTGFLLPGKVFNEATDEASPPSLSGTRGSVEGKSSLVCLIKLGIGIGEKVLDFPILHGLVFLVTLELVLCNPYI